jgi:predicted metal-dependent hydrolase
MTTPTIIITGTPDWADAIAQYLDGDYTLKSYQQTGPGYVARLTDDRAVLIVVDGDADGWRFWTTTPKTSPATRRIPIVLVSADSERRVQALVSGADFALAPADLAAELPTLVQENARVLDPAVIEQLECDCQDDLPPLGKQGVEKFNAGEYYPQHDLLEEQWMHTEGPIRNLYQAILQVGIAYFQVTRGNHRGALKMLLRSVQWLSMLPDECQGVDIKQLREDSYRVRAELERMNPEDIAQFDRSLLKPVRYTAKIE